MEIEKYWFLYKDNKESEENYRDCVKYVELKGIDTLECGHYFSGIRLCGACFSAGTFDMEEFENLDFDNIITILTKEEFKRLAEYNTKIKDLGYGLDEQIEKVKLGHKYNLEIADIIAKLKGEENEKLFEQVQEEEKEWLANEYEFTENELEEIWKSYYLDYRDRAIISDVYEDYESFGKYWANNCMSIPENLENYINYEKLGEDLIDEKIFCELELGKIVEFNY